MIIIQKIYKKLVELMQTNATGFMVLLTINFCFVGLCKSQNKCDFEKKKNYSFNKAPFKINKEEVVFKELNSWQVDLNNDQKKDTAIKYQIEEKDQSSFTPRSTLNGLLVLATKKNSNCKVTKYKFLRYAHKKTFRFLDDKFCMSLSTRGMGSSSRETCFTFNSSSSYPVLSHKINFTNPYEHSYEKIVNYKKGFIKRKDQLTDHENPKLKEYLRENKLPQESIQYYEKSDRYFKLLTASKINENSSKVESKHLLVHDTNEWKGAKDLSFNISIGWNQKDLRIKFEVTDDNVIFSNKAKILNQDHIELWFDFKPENIVKKKNTAGRHYSTLRTEMDSNVVQMLLNLQSEEKDLAVHNGRETFFKGLKKEVNFTDSGYTVDIIIPYKIFKEHFNIQFSPEQGEKIGFTALVSDTDNPNDKQQETLMGTSQLDYRNPYTMGRLKFVKEWERPYFMSKDYNY